MLCVDNFIFNDMQGCKFPHPRKGDHFLNKFKKNYIFLTSNNFFFHDSKQFLNLFLSILKKKKYIFQKMSTLEVHSFFWKSLKSINISGENWSFLKRVVWSSAC